MAAAAEPQLLTVEQYRQLPDREDALQELHWGQVVMDVLLDMSKLLRRNGRCRWLR